MKNQASKRTTTSRTKTLLSAAGLALVLTAGAPVAGGFEASIEGRAEAQLHRERKLLIGPYTACILWCGFGYCCWDNGPHRRPFDLEIEPR